MRRTIPSSNSRRRTTPDPVAPTLLMAEVETTAGAGRVKRTLLRAVSFANDERFPAIGSLYQVLLSATHIVMPGEGPASPSLQPAVKKDVDVGAMPRHDEWVAITGIGY